MRILHLLASADRRGAETFGLALAESLDGRGHVDQVIALAPSSSGADGLDVEVCEALRSPGALRSLRRSAGAADVVVAHGSRGLVAGTLATIANRTPLVYRSIGDPTFWGSSPARRWRVGVQLRRCAQVTALWPEAATAIATAYRVEPDRLAVVPNAADADRFAPASDADRAATRADLGVPDDSLLVAYVGAFAPEKRVDQIVEATAMVGRAHLVLAGDGPGRAEVAAAADAALPGRHHLLGAIADVERIVSASDVVVLLSTTEGQPGAAIEAALCGVPVVATDVGGTSSVVVDDLTGRLVSVDAVASEVAAAIEDLAARRHELASVAREHARATFGIDVVTDRWESVLRAAASPADRTR